MKNEKIVAAIAAYLEKQTRPCDVTSRVEYGHYEFLHRGASSNDLHAGFCREVAEKLAAAIAPYLEAGAGWEDAPSWANFKTTNYEGDTTYWEFRPDCTLLGFWVHGEKYGRIEVRELKRGHLEERPR